MLDDCGNVNAGITGGEVTIGASYDFGMDLLRFWFPDSAQLTVCLLMSLKMITP